MLNGMMTKTIIIKYTGKELNKIEKKELLKTKIVINVMINVDDDNNADD